MLRSLTIRAKLIGAFTFLAAVTLALGLVALDGVRTLSENTRSIQGNWLPSVQWSSAKWVYRRAPAFFPAAV